MSKPSRLIVFDVEGILLPRRRYLIFAASKMLGFLGVLKLLVIGILYEVGFLSLESMLRRIFKLFRGFKLEDLFKLYKNIPLMPDVMEVFQRLKGAGYKIALISSGLPTPIVKDLAARLDADYAFGLDLGLAEGYLTGEISGDVTKTDGKAVVLEKILDAEGITREECVVVADDRNNLPMFRLSALRIGYNPDFILTFKSDFVVKGGLSEVLSIVIGDAEKEHRPPLSSRGIVREAIHAAGLFVPILCAYLLDCYIVTLLIILTTMLYAVSEIARLRGIDIPLFPRVTRKAATKTELFDFIATPVYFAFGIVFSLVLFPYPANYASIMILSLGDSSATIFGKMFGRTKYPFNRGKRVEGSIFGFISAFLGSLVFLDPLGAFMGAAAGMLVECLPSPINDNITIPIVSGLVLTMFS